MDVGQDAARCDRHGPLRTQTQAINVHERGLVQWKTAWDCTDSCSCTRACSDSVTIHSTMVIIAICAQLQCWHPPTREPLRVAARLVSKCV